jgi:hypothetical protein
MGFIPPEEQEIVEPEFKVPINKAIVQSASKKSQTTTSSHTPLEQARLMYLQKQEWHDAGQTIKDLSFGCHHKITIEYGMSFLI